MELVAWMAWCVSSPVNVAAFIERERRVSAFEQKRVGRYMSLILNQT